MNALVVDDQFDVVQGLLSGVDWDALEVAHVYPAYSADEAIAVLQTNPVHVLLCDIEMPPRSGFDVLAFARNRNMPLECIFLTSHASFAYAQSAVRLGSFDYILQPARYEEITQAVGRAIGKLRENQQRYAAKPEPAKPDAGMSALQDVDMPPGEETQPVSLAIQYIRQNLSYSLTRTEIAEAVFLNPDYLSRLFRKQKGISLNDFIIREKITLACSLLEQTRIPISLVASKAGYTNFSYFSQLFKRVTGMTPLEYRKRRHEKW